MTDDVRRRVLRKALMRLVKQWDCRGKWAICPICMRYIRDGIMEADRRGR